MPPLVVTQFSQKTPKKEPLPALLPLLMLLYLKKRKRAIQIRHYVFKLEGNKSNYYFNRGTVYWNFSKKMYNVNDFFLDLKIHNITFPTGVCLCTSFLQVRFVPQWGSICIQIDKWVFLHIYFPFLSAVKGHSCNSRWQSIKKTTIIATQHAFRSDNLQSFISA